MRAALSAGLLTCLAVIAAGNSKAGAQTPDVSVPSVQNNFQAAPVNLNVLASFSVKTTPETATKTKPADVKPQPVVHEVGANESLTTIAEKYNTTWNRLFNKNEQIANPDIITVGDKVTIPLVDEQLADRALPEPPPVPVPVTAVAAPRAAYSPRAAAQPRSAPQAPAYSQAGSSAGNTYSQGYCTWYAKNMRPDLPNNLGNAITWVSSAAAQGLATGSAPRVGAIGQRGNHVVFIQSVNEDGTVTVSEMNYAGFGVVSSRTVPGNYFSYIY